jgi:hypothetical protein
MSMQISEISMEMFISGTKIDWIESLIPEIRIPIRNPKSHVSWDRL